MVLLLGDQNLTQFLRHYWLSKYGVVRERDLYKAMKAKFSHQNAVLGLMAELREAADKYGAITDVDHPVWKEHGTPLRKDLETLQLFGLSQFRPLLLAGLSALRPEQLPKAIGIIVALSMRYSIIGGYGTGNIEKAYSDAAIAIREGKADTGAKIFNALRDIYPEDDRFQADFTVAEVTKPKLARYILASLANVMSGSSELGVIEDETVVNLEHIMPKTGSSEWLDAAVNDDEYLEYVNRIGNLTLIEAQKNTAASNAPFEKKKADAFCKSDIAITKKLCEFDEWTVDEIQARQVALAIIARAVWSVPY